MGPLNHHSPCTCCGKDVQPRSRGGSILVLVLWVLFFLAALSVAVGTRASATLRFAGELKRRAEARSLAMAGVARAIAVIDGVTNAADLVDVPDYLGPSGTLPGGTHEVVCVSVDKEKGAVTNWGVCWEGAKKDLNRISQAELAAVIEKTGQLQGDAAGAVASAILRCRNGNDDLTEVADVAYSAPSQYRCQRKQFQLLSELNFLEEVRSVPELVGALEPYVTVYDDACFSGTAIGTVEGDPPVMCRISFVVERGGRRRLWYEH